MLRWKNREPVREVFNINQLEKEIEEEVRRFLPAPVKPQDYAPKLPLPAYVEHLPEVETVGRISAEAVLQEYEATAMACVEMGKELIALGQRVVQMTADITEADKFCAGTAELVRAKGKEVFLTIENASLKAKEVRAICEDMRKRLEPRDGP